MKSQYGLTENFRLIDTRLLLCTVAVLFTVIAFVYDYLCPYPESRYVLMVCIASYPFEYIIVIFKVKLEIRFLVM